MRAKGILYEFLQIKRDQYGQPIDDEHDVIGVIGIYHEVNTFIKVESGDASSVQRKKSPMVLTLHDYIGDSLKQGDLVHINGVKYAVSGITDIQNYGVVSDISLEMEV